MVLFVGLVLSSEELYQSGGLTAPQSTAEDSRMIAFFDSLVQRELTDWSLSGDSSASSSDGDGRRPDSPRPGAECIFFFFLRNVALLYIERIFFILKKKCIGIFVNKLGHITGILINEKETFEKAVLRSREQTQQRS
jgi:hypothetical protein